MSIALIKIKKEELPIFKKIIKAFTGAKVRIIKNEGDYREELIAKLIEEGLKSKIVPEKIIKNDFKEYGVDL